MPLYKAAVDTRLFLPGLSTPARVHSLSIRQQSLAGAERNLSYSYEGHNNRLHCILRIKSRNLKATKKPPVQTGCLQCRHSVYKESHNPFARGSYTPILFPWPTINSAVRLQR